MVLRTEGFNVRLGPDSERGIHTNAEISMFRSGSHIIPMTYSNDVTIIKILYKCEIIVVPIFPTTQYKRQWYTK